MEGKWVEGGRGLDQATQPRAEELPAGAGGRVGGSRRARGAERKSR